MLEAPFLVPELATKELRHSSYIVL